MHVDGARETAASRQAKACIVERATMAPETPCPTISREGEQPSRRQPNDRVRTDQISERAGIISPSKCSGRTEVEKYILYVQRPILPHF